MSEGRADDAGKRLLIVDTDPGIDDAMALLFLHAQPDISLHSITTVFGNADIATITRNARFLAERFQLGVPIIAGAGEALAGGRHIPALKVHGEDGLGDSGAASNTAPVESGPPAWQHIAETIRRHPGEVTLLSIGPLTNLALALRDDPGIAELVGEVVVMGGAFGTAERHGNITPHAEANFFYDPEAADAVLAANWPVTVVGLDVSSDCILSSAEALRLGQEGGSAGRFLWEISRDYEAIYRQYDGLDGFCIHDVAAAAYVVRREWFTRQASAVEVLTEGERKGASIALANGRRPEQHYCVAVDHAQVIKAYTDAILRQAAGAYPG